MTKTLYSETAHTADTVQAGAVDPPPVTDEELRKGLEVSWKRRTLKAVAGGQNA